MDKKKWISKNQYQLLILPNQSTLKWTIKLAKIYQRNRIQKVLYKNWVIRRKPLLVLGDLHLVSLLLSHPLGFKALL